MNSTPLKTLMAALAFFASFNASSQQKEFGWLLGTWQLKDKAAFERWSLDSDQQTLCGVSYHINNATDTVITEQIALKLQQGKYYYIPDVVGDQAPVAFKIIHHDYTMFVAENKEHDFPKVIRYKLVRKNNQDINEASIEGDGKVISYTFVRLK